MSQRPEESPLTWGTVFMRQVLPSHMPYDSPKLQTKSYWRLKKKKEKP